MERYSMIELRNICKKYDRVIFDNISLVFQPNRSYLIKGPSGSGKTTLLNILSGIDVNYTGNVFIDQKELREYSAHERRRVFSYILQQSLLISGLTIYENLKFICNDHDRILEVANWCGITDFFKSYPSQLSNGQRQKVAIARALLDDPSVILADEPTSSLDYESASEIAELLIGLSKLGKIVIVSSHDPVFNHGFDQVISVEDGSVRVESFNHVNIEETTYNKKNLANSQFLIDLLYVCQRLKRSVTTRFLLRFSVFFLFFVALSSSIYNHILIDRIISQKSLINVTLVKNEYLSEKQIEKLLVNYDIKQFEVRNYFDGAVLHIEVIEDFDMFSDHSVLRAIGKANISQGTKHLDESSVLVNDVFASKYLLETGQLSILQEKIYVNELGREYTVNGVVATDKLDIYKLSGGIGDSGNYQLEVPVIFYKTNTLQKVSVENDSYSFVFLENLDELSNDELLDLQILFNGLAIINQREISQNFAYLVLVVGFLLSLILGVFITNSMILELSLRKKEIGYLLLFKVSQKRVMKILIMEYMFSMIPAIITSFLAFNFLLAQLSAIFDFEYIEVALNSFLALIVIIIYVILIAYVPTHKLLRSNLHSLLYG